MFNPLFLPDGATLWQKSRLWSAKIPSRQILAETWRIRLAETHRTAFPITKINVDECPHSLYPATVRRET